MSSRRQRPPAGPGGGVIAGSDSGSLPTSTDKAEPISQGDARQRIDRVKQNAELIASDVAALYEGRAWLALDYTGWDEMCEAEFGSRIKLPRADRQELVGDLTARGLSSRAIAAALGVDQKTVVNDRRAAGEEYSSVTGLDGRIYKRIPQPGDDVDPRPLSPQEQEAWDVIHDYADFVAQEEARIDALSMQAAADLTVLFEDDFWVREWSKVYPAPEGADPRSYGRFTEWLNWRAEYEGAPAMTRTRVRQLLNAQRVADRLTGGAA